ncbi:MAG: hypothetical protein IKE69_13510 [Thermoguttaceae bacterium]|nr:hypothetical protein [Thermoguttaceae bacterium]
MKSFLFPKFVWETILVSAVAVFVLTANLFAEEAAGRTVWNAVEYGAAPDGATDCTEAIQNALNDAFEAGGGTVSLPAGRFAVRGNLSVPRGVTLEGTYRSALTIDHIDQKVDGTILLAYAGRGSNEGPAFITLAGTNAVVKGVAVIYPEWDRKDVPPVPYPPCIESHDTNNVAVIDCCLLNPYEGIKFVRAARHLVRNVTGYPIWRGLFVDQCYDIGHIENIHYWPFGLAYDPADPYCEWINVNGVAFELARTDWHYMSNLFCFGYGVGYKFSDYGHGGTNGNFLGLGADSCRRAVLVEAAQLPGLLITNGEFVGRWTSTDSVCIEVTEKAAGKVSLNNCSFWGPIETCIRFNAPDCQLTANACHFCHWDNARKGAPAIRIEAGKSIVSSCTFMDWGLCVSLGSKVRSAVLTGNQGPNGFTWAADSEKVKVKDFANEDPADVLDPEALVSYKVTFGQPRDLLFAEGVYGPEKGSDFSFRWSAGQSALKLPFPKDQPAEVEFQAVVPQTALSENAGIYLAGEKLAAFSEPGRKNFKFTLPPQKNGKVRLDIIVNPWNPPPGDSRTLGIQYLSVQVKAPRALTNRYFDINQQEWIGE